MVQFNSVNPIQKPNNTNNFSRITQQQVRPTAVKPAALAQTTLSNTIGDVVGPFSITNGNSIQITSFLQNEINPQAKIAAAPYGIIFIQDSPSLDHIIGSPQGIPANIGYYLYGPTAMPQFTPNATNINGVITIGGNDGNNIIFLTELVNRTGSTQTIFYLTNTRIYTTIGGDTASTLQTS